MHDVRTSLRRLEASFSLLPKKQRSVHSKHINAYKEFFRSNSRVRDCDIIRDRIVSAQNKNETKVTSLLAKRRQSELKRALKLAQQIRKMKPLKLEKINDEKLEQRIDKVARSLVSRVKELLPVVVSESKEKQLLHELRKDLKKLRYILEILPDNYRKKYGEKLAKIIGRGSGKDPVASRLQDLQDVLGSIHDADIAIEYLQEIKYSGSVLDKENDIRGELYRRFVGMMGA